MRRKIHRNKLIAFSAFTGILVTALTQGKIVAARLEFEKNILQRELNSHLIRVAEEISFFSETISDPVMHSSSAVVQLKLDRLIYATPGAEEVILALEKTNSGIFRSQFDSEGKFLNPENRPAPCISPASSAILELPKFGQMDVISCDSKRLQLRRELEWNDDRVGTLIEVLNLETFIREKISNLKLDPSLFALEILPLNTETTSGKQPIARISLKPGSFLKRSIANSKNWILVGLAFSLVLLLLGQIFLWPLVRVIQLLAKITSGAEWDRSESQFSWPFHRLNPHISRLIEMVEKQTEVLAAESAQKTRELVARKIRHDIQAPLTAIRAATRELNETHPSHMAAKVIGPAVSSIEAMLEEITPDPQPPTRETTDLNSLLEEVHQEFRLRTAHRITFTSSQKLRDIRLPVPREKLKRVLSNLIQNSIEATSQDQGQIRIEADGDHNWVKITVSDNGPGIPEAVSSQLGKKAISWNKPGGQGLGLFSAFEDVHSWGGNLSVIGHPSIGTRVDIILPAAREVSPQALEESLILLLDNDPIIRAIWKHSAKRTGIALSVFQRPEDLLRSVDDFPRSSRIYLDYELDSDLSCPAVIDRLLEKNFTQLFIATGHSPEDLKLIAPRVRGIIGKEPPWEKSAPLPEPPAPDDFSKEPPLPLHTHLHPKIN